MSIHNKYQQLSRPFDNDEKEACHIFNMEDFIKAERKQSEKNRRGKTATGSSTQKLPYGALHLQKMRSTVG